MQLLFVSITIFIPGSLRIRRRIEPVTIVAYRIVMIDSHVKVSRARRPRQILSASVRRLTRAIKPVGSVAEVVLVGMADIKMSGLQICNFFIHLAIIVGFLCWHCAKPRAVDFFLKCTSLDVDKIGHVVSQRHFFTLKYSQVLLANQMHVG